LRPRVARIIGGDTPPAAPTILIQPTNRTELAGTWVDLLVGAVGTPQPHFQWQLNGTNIPGATRSRHIISYALDEDSGTYTAIVSNELGVVVSDPSVLTVNSYPPGFTRHPTNQTLIEGQNLRHVVITTGAPQPLIQWQLNGTNLPAPQQPLYYATNVTVAHAGQYWAVASNIFGLATSQVAQVTITPAATNAGAVDISFVPQPVPWGPNYPTRAAVMQPDGSIVAGGDSGRIWRWMPDGRFDTSFIYSAPFNVKALALQPDGKIVAGGDLGPRIVRVNANGSPDDSFQGLAYAIDRIKALAVQPDGKIIFAANSPSSGGFTILGRITSNGLPDVNFRAVVAPLPPGGSIGTAVEAYGLLLQPDGKILFASSLEGIVRYLPHGARDLSFSRFLLGIPVSALGMALQNDGKLAVGWYGNNDFARTFVRLNEDGSPDAGFTPNLGGGVGGTAGAVYDVAVQPDGKILAVGSLTNRTRLMRFHPNGALDHDFARGEIQLNPNPFLRLLMTAECKPLVVGTFSWFNNYERPGAFRVLTDPPSSPVVTRQPAPVTVHRGQIAHVSGDVTCPPAPAYQWFFNDAPLAGATQPRLTITNAETTNAGNYSLSVTNPLGSNQSAVVSLTVNPAPTNAGAVDVDFGAAIPNDTVLSAVRQPDGKLLIAGYFTRVGTNDRTCVARLNTDGSLDTTFDAGVITNSTFGAPPQPAFVAALALQSDGRILMGGLFTGIGGQLRRNLARLEANGALDSNFINGPVSSSVLALALQADRKILVSQTYYSPGLLRLTTNGAQDSTFQYAPSLLPNRTIKSIALQPDGRILIGGDFTSVSGSQRTGLARLLTNGLVDNTLADIQTPVDTMALLPDAIVIGGAFTSVRGLSQRYLAAVSYSGLVLSNVWRPMINQPVRLLVKDSCDRVLAAGGFTNTGSSVVRGLLRFLPDGQSDATFSLPVFNSSVRAIAFTDDARILGAGDFTEVNGCYRPGVARLFEGALTAPVFVYQPTNIATVMGRDFMLSAAVLCPPGTIFRWQLNGVDLLGQTNTALTIRNSRSPQAGDYQLVASNQFGMSTSAVATVTLSPAPTKPGDNDIDFYPDILSAQRVTAMALQPNGKLLAAHGPLGISSKLVRFNSDGSPDPSFFSTIPEVASLVVGPNGSIYALTGNRLYRLHSDGETDTNFVVSYAGGFFTDLAFQPDGKPILLGRFTSTPGPQRVRRFDTAGSVDPGFTSPDFDSQATSLVLQPDGKVLVGGGFAAAGVVHYPRLARLNANGTYDSNFLSGFTTNAWVNALAVQDDGRIMVTGNFTNYAGQLRRNIVRLHANGAVDPTFDGSLTSAGFALAVQRDGKVLVAGTASMQAGTQAGIVRLLANGAPDPSFKSGPVGWGAGLISELLLAPDGDIYIGSGFISYDGFTRFGLARLHGNPVLSGPAYASGSFTTSLFTDPGRTYHLESTPSLANPMWSIVQTINGNGAVQIFGDSPAGAARYYRVRAE
jgi:uncharacterized delta-60 repeat protein